MEQTLVSKLKKLVQEIARSPRLALATLGLAVSLVGILIGSGLFIYSREEKTSSQLQNEKYPKSSTSKTQQDLDQSASTPSAQLAQITVDVSGAVKKPGIYQLNPDSRVFHALEAAGGLSSKADTVLIQQKINFAEKVKEGQKVFFPYLDQYMPKSSSSSESTTQDEEKPTSINSASLSDLDLLPGIGMTLAQKIVDGRPYSKLEDLTEKKVLGQSVFEKVREKITL